MRKYLSGLAALSAGPLGISTLPSAMLNKRRLDGDALAELVHHLLFELIGALRQRRRFCVLVHGLASAFRARIWATDSIASTIAW